MRSPALAMGWEFRRRHLWALIAMAGYLLALAAIKLLFLRPMEPIRLDPPDGRAAVVITPLTATYFYLLAAFSFGLAGDLGAANVRAGEIDGRAARSPAGPKLNAASS